MQSCVLEGSSFSYSCIFVWKYMLAWCCVGICGSVITALRMKWPRGVIFPQLQYAWRWAHGSTPGGGICLGSGEFCPVAPYLCSWM